MTLTAPLTRLAGLLATPLVPADFVELLTPLQAGGTLRGRITAVLPETRDAATLQIRPGRGWRGHVPGQYLRLGVDVDGVRHWRSYSITSTPGSATVAITVKAIPGGLVSNHLVRRAKAGTVVQLELAAGEFVLPAAQPRAPLFITAGSGVTPVMGILRSHPGLGAVVIHSAPTTEDVIFGAELRALAAQGRLTLIERHTDTDGLLGVADLHALVPDLAERETWACGPGAMLDDLEKHWEQNGFARPLHTERFRATIHAVGEGGTASYLRSSVDAVVEPGTSLLDAGEAAGVLMPSGCRMGVCFGCVLPLREGSVRDLRSGDVTTGGDGVLVQTCISTAAGDCHLDV